MDWGVGFGYGEIVRRQKLRGLVIDCTWALRGGEGIVKDDLVF